MSNRLYYTVYLNDTDEVVVCGLADECAKAMNKSLNCFYSMVSKNRFGKSKKYTVYSEKIESFEVGEMSDI